VTVFDVGKARANAVRAQQRPAAQPNGSTREYLLLVLIVALAAVLRFYKLGEWSFWSDEYTTVQRALTLFEDGFAVGSLSRMATYLTMDLWGISEASARLPAAVFGLLTVPVLYFLVKRMFDPVVALIASALLAIAPWHVYWSQNARFYAPLLFFYTLALFFFHFYLEKDRLLYFFLSAVFFGLALNERLIALFLLPIAVGYVALLVVLRFDRPIGLRRDRLSLYLGLLVAVGLLVSLEPGVVNPEQMAATFSAVNNSPQWIVAGVLFYLGLPLTCAAVAGGYFLLTQKKRAALLLGLAAIVPLGSIVTLSVFQYAANRYVFVSLTSVIVLAAVAIKELLWQAPRKLRPVVAGFVLILFLAPMADNVIYFKFQNGNRDNWKDAFALIASRKLSEDQVVSIDRRLADYYMSEQTTSLLTIDDIDEFVRASPRTWFVVDGTVPSKVPQTYRWILAHTEFVASFDVSVSARTFPMRIYLYDPARPPNGSDSQAAPTGLGRVDLSVVRIWRPVVESCLVGPCDSAGVEGNLP
jgi:hypothetical protein